MGPPSLEDVDEEMKLPPLFDDCDDWNDEPPNELLDDEDEENQQ